MKIQKRKKFSLIKANNKSSGSTNYKASTKVQGKSRKITCKLQ